MLWGMQLSVRGTAVFAAGRPRNREHGKTGANSRNVVRHVGCRPSGGRYFMKATAVLLAVFALVCCALVTITAQVPKAPASIQQNR